MTNSVVPEAILIRDLHANWTPHKEQLDIGKRIIKGDVDVVHIQCGRKWGKTDFALYVLWRFALLKPGSSCYYIAPEITHAKALIWHNRRLEYFGKERYEDGRIKVFSEDKLAKYIDKVYNQEGRITFKNGSQIIVTGSENWAAANGLTPDVAVYDEFKVFHAQFHNEFNPNRIVRHAPLVNIGTPPKPEDRNRKQYIELAQQASIRSDQIHIESSSYSNPHIDPKSIDKEIAVLRERGEEDVVQREYYGKLVYGGKNAIFNMFKKKKFVYPEQDIQEILREKYKKLDYFCIVNPSTINVTGVLFCAIDKHTRKIYIIDEIYETSLENLTSRKLYPKMQKVMEDITPGKDIQDTWITQFKHGSHWFSKESMGSYGIYFHPSNKEMNNEEEGISLIRDILFNNMVCISDKCPNLINEMLEWAKDKKNNLIKDMSHLITCFRLLLDASYYDMNEVPEIKKTEDKMPLRGFRLEDDLKQISKESNWIPDEDF
jgi:hypothetical protein